MRKGLFLSVCLIVLCAYGSFNKTNGQSGFIQKNDLYIGVDEKSFGGITEDEYHYALDRVADVYDEMVIDKGAKLDIVRSWDSGEVFALAKRDGDQWIIEMNGGLARHEDMNFDGFSLVACHELGHHFGGLPKKSSWWPAAAWIVAEGQADYYSVSKCLRKVFANDNNKRIVAGMEIPRIVTNKCKKAWKTDSEVAMCQRTAMAGRVVANFFESIIGNEKVANFETPDSNIVPSTNFSGYPSIQCRLDTYFAAALCSIDKNVDPSNTDKNRGNCTRENDQSIGARPLCWYHP